jgi:1-acyl-sn-glycerol-3-phosphate acyltransferase
VNLTQGQAPASWGELAFYKVARFVTVGLSRLYFPGRVFGKENMLETGACIVAPVHRSYVDWLIVARVSRRRRLRYIAKAELWRSKLFAPVIEALGAFPVNRSGADREALERCREVLAGGEPLVMFPEGTRRSGPLVTDLREGVAYLALRAGVPVIPVGIGGSEQAMPRGSVIPRPRRVQVVIGAPLWPPTAGGVSEGTRVSRKATKAFSDELGEHIQAAFDEARRRAGVSS